MIRILLIAPLSFMGGLSAYDSFENHVESHLEGHTYETIVLLHSHLSSPLDRLF